MANLALKQCVCCQGYHGIICGACDGTHGKAKSGRCIDCSPKWIQIVMALCLALWSATITTFVLRRALSFGGIDGNDHEDNKAVWSSSIPQAYQGKHSSTNIPRDSKEELMNTKDALRSIKKAQHSQSPMAIVESLEEVASSLTKKSYVSEIGKVMRAMQEKSISHYLFIFLICLVFIRFMNLIQNHSIQHVSCKHLSCNVLKGKVHHCICKF